MKPVTWRSFVKVCIWWDKENYSWNFQIGNVLKRFGSVEVVCVKINEDG
jgi:hypothetical protein